MFAVSSRFTEAKRYVTNEMQSFNNGGHPFHKD